MAKPGTKSKVALPEVSVRAVHDTAERVQWGRLMDAHHYLGFRCLYGGGVWHVAETAHGRWVTLLEWSAGAFKVAARYCALPADEVERTAREQPGYAGDTTAGNDPE